MPNRTSAELVTFATQLLTAGGASPAEAQRVAESLVGAELRGYSSHGMMRIPFYIRMIADGKIVPQAELKILEESDTRIVADANWGIGQVQAMDLTERLLEKAKSSGLAIGTMIHSGHIGRLGEYCETAAAAGMVSLFMVNSHGGVVRVAPPGGKAPRLSTNPLAIGAPHDDSPLVLDFSTSATAEGKVRVQKIAGKPCPEGWLLDSDGKPTTNPEDLYSDPPGSILPMGGNQTYKGFGLGLMIEIFTGALSGGVTARETPYPNKGNCVFAMLLNPEKFGGADHFAAEVNQLVTYIRDCPRVDGVEQITLPGDPERAIFAKRSAEGTDIDVGNWGQLTDLAKELGVEPPA